MSKLIFKTTILQFFLVTTLPMFSQKVLQTDTATYVLVEQQPSFPGGEKALFKFISENIQYPVEAQINQSTGVVVCQFTVNEDGLIDNIICVRKADPVLVKEAIRLIKSMPKWLPGLQNNQPVKTKFTLPITFRMR